MQASQLEAARSWAQNIIKATDFNQYKFRWISKPEDITQMEIDPGRWWNRRRRIAGQQPNGLRSETARRSRFRKESVAPTVELPAAIIDFEIDDQRMSLIVVPEKCWLDPVKKRQKVWGISTQLYLLRSEHNWGIGDFADLRDLIDVAAEWGASVVGLNPFHALSTILNKQAPTHRKPRLPERAQHRCNGDSWVRDMWGGKVVADERGFRRSP
jgi:hypothetical protein